MDVRPVTALKTLSQRGLALILANALFWQPLLAQADGIVVSGPGTTVGQAGNGVPVVNIATPNGSGLSHNQFKDYNVGPNGVILNNANSIVQSTQLGGIIVGNPNLKGGAANVILNEVKGGSPSQLRGYTEVAGQSAKVIVANPYGISCNGCGFINTPNVTLTTGKPVIDQAGQLKSYQVDGGAVTIDGKGLNASNVDHFEIITRSAKINAQINAKQLTVIAGRNDVDAQSLKTTARADDGSTKPELAIDSSALGGMYAGAIKLVGTEAGVGVKLDGTLAASGGDIQLDANGHLSMAQAAASGAVDIKAASLETKGAVYAGTTLKAQTKGTLKNSKTLAARDSITLASNGQLTNSGIVEAGVNADNTRNAGGDVTLDSQHLTNTGTVIANRSLTATAQSLDNQGATLSAKQALNVTAASVDNRNKGRLLSDGAQTLNVSGLLDNSQGGIIDSTGAFTLNGNTLDNSTGSLTAGGAITLDLIGDLINRNGKLASAGPLLIQRAAHVDNQGGKLASQGLLTVFANSIDNRNTGTLAANAGLTLTTSGLLQNSGNGLIHSENAGVTITAGTLDNNGGRIAAKGGDAQIDATDFNNGSGALFARDRVHLTGMNVDNGGEIAGNRIDISLEGALNNRGLIESATALDVETASLNNSGQMRALGASGKTRYAIGGLLNNSGSLETANDQLSLAANRFQNTGGKVLHVGTGVLDLSGISLDDVGGSLVTNGDLTFDKVNWTNSTAIQAGRLTVNVDNLQQTATGKLLGTRALVGSGKDWIVGGSVASQGSLDLSVGNLLNDHGLIFSGGDLNLKVERLKNLGATIYAMGNLRVDRDGQGGLATSIINSSGTIESERNLVLAASTIQNIRTVLTTESGIYSASITPIACIDGVTGGDCEGGKQNRPFQITQRDHFIVSDATAASSITSGGNMLLTGGELLNSSSSIAAGGNLTAIVNQLTNVGVVTHDTQYDRVFTSARERKPGGWYREAAAFTQRYSAGQDMTGVEAGLASFIGKMEGEKDKLRKTTQLMAPDQSYAAVIQAGGSVDVKAQAGIDNSVVRGGYTYVGSGANTNAPGYSTLVSLNAQLPPDVAQQQVNPLRLPGFDLPTGQNGLFHLNDSDGAKGLPTSQFAASPHKYLIETNPLFTAMRKFLGSDYMLTKLGYDPDTAQKRLGDGFYEQRLIQQAVLARTGQRFIDGQTSDADLFKHLMDNAIGSKTALNLSVGVSLTAEQVAALTHDIVWLENATVAGQQVLVPVLYLAQANNRLAPNGALISGTDVNLITGSNLNNAGTLRATGNLLANVGGNLTNSGLMEAAGRLDLLAGNNLSNRAGGVISAGNVNLAAGADLLNERSVTTHESASSYRTERSDFVNSAARIESANDLAMQAGGNVNNVGGVLKSGADTTVKTAGDVNITASKSLDSGAIGNRSSFTTIAQQGSVVEAGRDLHVIGGRDISAVASQVNAKRNLAMAATGNLSLGSVANEQHSASNSKKVTSREDHVQQVGTSLVAGDNLSLSAGNDLLVSASRASAGKEAYLYAGNDLALNAVQDSDYSYYRKTKTSSGLLSSSQKTRIDSSNQISQQGSSISADTVVARAGRDIGTTASDVVSTNATSLIAGRNVVIDGATETFGQSHSSSTKKSGLMSSGGIGVTLGSSSNQNTFTSSTETTRASNIGSVLGSVDVQASKDLTIRGSDVVAGKDISLIGQNVSILASENNNRSEQTAKSKTSGLTLALSGTVGSAVDSAYKTAKQAKNEDDGRLSALQGVKAGLTGVQAWQAAQQNGGMTSANAGQFVGIAISLGSQKSSSKQTQEQTANQGSSLTSGNNLSIVAAGNGTPGADGDIRVQGSKLQAGNEMLLAAERDIRLEAAANTQKLDGKNSSGGGAIGVSLGFGSSGAGLSIFANANKGSGNEKGTGTTWTETTLDAGKQVSLISGRDTVLKGAQVSADQIKATVGRDLTLQSLQDTDDYKSKQTDVSGGASFTIGTMTGSGSLSVSKSKIDSNYKSVQEQTGLFGGKGGYQIDVGNHTQLDGSVIASTATPDKNRLSTGTLGWSVLKNKADYTSQLQSASVSSGNNGVEGFISNMPSGTLVAFNHGDSDSGTTSSAISNGTLDIRDPAKQQQDVATLSHDVEHANGSISPIFDKEKEQKRLRQVQLIADIGTQASDIVRTQGAINAANAQKDPEAIAAARDKLIREGNTRPTDEQIAAQVTRTVMQPYGTGGDYQRAAQAVTAALQGLAGGDIGSALAGASAPYLANLIKQSTQGNDTARIMAHVVLGAVVAQAQGNSAGAGAAGAGTGELIAARLYPDIKTENLSEEQRQTVSALSTLASGLAGGLAGGDLSGAIAGAKAGNNAVENNSLGDIASALAEGKTLEQKAEERIKAENERYKERNCAGLSAQACSVQMYDERRENLAYTVAGGAVVAGTVAGAMLLGPALLNACGMNPVVCTELTLTAVELPFGAATAGGTALGVGGFGRLAAKEVAATADAAAAARNVETAKGSALDAKGAGTSLERDLAYENPSNLVQNRVSEIQSQIPANSQGRITMGVAVVEDTNGVRSVLVSTSEPRGYLRPGVSLQEGEKVVVGTGHAEADIVSYANANGLKVVDIGATRPVCASCQNVIEPTGANVSTPLKPLPKAKQ
ncbi:adhesin [Pseudomonas sp. S10E 269]|uniref:two-partner secretion domain-containing protein n=1 Tax=unclassified Pseudomonas TaxID=196821 RepID=UPI000C256543|nr:MULTISPECIES: hemagglutinin repeat-containing protein [unclassified Pseudomonas]MBT1263790.1 hemagglutinin repeat-containing protein [Pseudomonas sp. VS40]MBT1275705.1 hemagglutinin repeat-containing protein [Pseudomonas sp. VS59]PJK35466.1 adhesin [Pseudomonas sp. S09F 262]PJK39407.1 adhesin [Pseudomonas sp. S10E 269]